MKQRSVSILLELIEEKADSSAQVTSLNEEAMTKLMGGYGYSNTGCSNTACAATNSGCMNQGCTGGTGNSNCTNSGCTS